MVHAIWLRNRAHLTQSNQFSAVWLDVNSKPTLWPNDFACTSITLPEEDKEMDFYNISHKFI